MTGNLRANPCLRAIRAVLDAEGIPFKVSHGGKHPCVTFTLGDRHVRNAFPKSPSDRRSALNAAAQIKRIIRKRSHNREQR